MSTASSRAFAARGSSRIANAGVDPGAEGEAADDPRRRRCGTSRSAPPRACGARPASSLGHPLSSSSQRGRPSGRACRSSAAALSVKVSATIRSSGTRGSSFNAATNRSVRTVVLPHPAPAPSATLDAADLDGRLAAGRSGRASAWTLFLREPAISQALGAKRGVPRFEGPANPGHAPLRPGHPAERLVLRSSNHCKIICVES